MMQAAQKSPIRGPLPNVMSGQQTLDMIQYFFNLKFGDPNDFGDLQGRVYSAYQSFETITATGNIGNNAVTYIDATAGDVTATLPDPALVAGRLFTVKRTDAGAHTVTVQANNSGTFDGSANFTLASNKTIAVHSNGVEYKKIGSF